MLFDTEECALLQATTGLFVWGLPAEEDTERATLKGYVSDTCPQMKRVSVKLSLETSYDADNTFAFIKQKEKKVAGKEPVRWCHH